MRNLRVAFVATALFMLPHAGNAQGIIQRAKDAAKNLIKTDSGEKSLPTSSNAHVDILNIQLGVSDTASVRSILAAPEMDLVVKADRVWMQSDARAEGQQYGRRIDIPGSAYVPRMSGTSRSDRAVMYDPPCAHATSNCQDVRVAFAGPPNAAVAYSVSRTIHFMDKPLADVVVKNLVAKYGPFGYEDRYHTMFWAWDVDGKPVKLDARHPCASQIMTSGGQDRPLLALRNGCAVVMFASLTQENGVVTFETVQMFDHFTAYTTDLKTQEFLRGVEARFLECERQKAARTAIAAPFSDAPAGRGVVAADSTAKAAAKGTSTSTLPCSAFAR